MSEFESNEEKKELDLQSLKDIYIKCTKKYEGKYQGPIFGVNVVLNESEISEIEKLIENSEVTLKNFTDKDPLYQEFLITLREMREKLGTFGEEGRITANDNVKNS